MKIVAYIPSPEDGTSFYRGVGPLSELHKTDKNIQVDFKRYCSFTDIKGYDLAFFQRPFRKEEIQSIKLCKQMGIPVVIDYDDDFFNVPVNNEFRKLNETHQNDYVSHVKECLGLADMVFASTSFLAETLKEFNDNVKVVNNAWDHGLVPMAESFNYTKNILWRGGQSHASDLFVFQNKFEELLKKNKDFKFIFLGVPPVWASNYKNAEFIKTKPVLKYFRILKMIKPSLILTPLKDYVFNHSKSNIAKLEAVTHGALCLAPDWDEWRFELEDEHLYSNPAEFFDEAMDLMEGLRNKDLRLLKEWEKCRDFVINNYRLEDLDKLRVSYFEQTIDFYRRDINLDCYGDKNE